MSSTRTWRPPAPLAVVATTAVAGAGAAFAIRQIAALSGTPQTVDLPSATTSR